MITLPNGHSFDFCCASGALGFDGNGYWWEQPFRWLDILKPSDFTIIAKTVTYWPRAGNLKMWCPWRCVRLVPGGAINAVGLTNPGLEYWMTHHYLKAIRNGYSLIASICPATVKEAISMIDDINLFCPDLKAIELNLSCPNVGGCYQPIAVTEAVRSISRHPLIAKLGPLQVEEMVTQLDPFVDAFDLINTVVWSDLHPGEPSPLAKYGLMGGLSGTPIRDIALLALREARNATDKPIISGGGIDSVEECLLRRDNGADAFSLGTVFLRAPWRPNRIVQSYRRLQEKTGVAQRY